MTEKSFFSASAESRRCQRKKSGGFPGSGKRLNILHSMINCKFVKY